jgi:hypothetical protein
MIPTTMRSRTHAALAALLVLAAGCGMPFGGDRLDDARHDLRVARSRWSALGGGSYAFTVQPLCYCVLRAMRVTVTGGQVASRVFVDNAQTVPADQETRLSTADGMFALIDEAIGRDAASIHARYDARGVPVEVGIDYQANVADEEFGWNVTDFTLR